jgi:hypothetical protein
MCKAYIMMLAREEVLGTLCHYCFQMHHIHCSVYRKNKINIELLNLKKKKRYQDISEKSFLPDKTP